MNNSWTSYNKKAEFFGCAKKAEPTPFQFVSHFWIPIVLEELCVCVRSASKRFFARLLCINRSKIVCQLSTRMHIKYDIIWHVKIYYRFVMQYVWRQEKSGNTLYVSVCVFSIAAYVKH